MNVRKGQLLQHTKVDKAESRLTNEEEVRSKCGGTRQGMEDFPSDKEMMCIV